MDGSEHALERLARHAHEVVGLYGDPDATWGIVVDLGLTAPVEPALVARRLRDLTARHPHLGRTPDVSSVPAEQWLDERDRVAGAPFPPGDALLRVLLRADGRRLLLVAHHGACDGLGLMAVAAAVAGGPLRTDAAGMAGVPGHRGFLWRSVRRLVEALFSPPPRFPGSGSASTPGEHLVSRSLGRESIGTGALCRALGRLHADATVARRGRRPLMLVGVSARTDREPVPDRQTRYLRLRVDPAWTVEDTRRALWSSAPEPDFPETSARGLGPFVVRLLRRRLGGTALVSNLGALESAAFTDVALFPATSGPQAVAVGCSSTDTATTLTVRTRRSEFTAAETEALLEALVAELAAPSSRETAQ